jgi:EpsI family protein
MNRNMTLRLIIVLAVVTPLAAMNLHTRALASRIPVVIETHVLPPAIGDWIGNEIPLTDQELSALQSPSASQRVYVNQRTGDVIQVLLIQVNNTQNAHDPKLCMAGSGFGLASLEEPVSPWVGAGDGARVSHALFAREGVQVDMFYWLQTASGTIADMSSGFKIEGIRRALRGEPTKGVAVRLISLPKSGVEPSDPSKAIELWREISAATNMKSLLERL